MNLLYHLTTPDKLSILENSDEYVPDAYHEDGFIHCSYKVQVADTVTRHFSGIDYLLLLEIDRSMISCPVVDENTSGGSELFPHVYGALPVKAIRTIHHLKRENGESFNFQKIGS